MRNGRALLRLILRMEIEMRLLETKEIEVVAGGTAADDAAAVRANAQTAENTCGKGNVASVSTTGFSCK